MAALIPVTGPVELVAPPPPGSHKERPELLYWEDPSGARWYFYGRKDGAEERNPRAESWVARAVGRCPGVLFGSVLFLSPDEVRVMTGSPEPGRAGPRKSKTGAPSKGLRRSRT